MDIITMHLVFFPRVGVGKKIFKKLTVLAYSIWHILGPSMRPEMVGAMNFTIYVPLTCRDGNNGMFSRKVIKIVNERRTTG